jgi:sugar lactone lactonase YvrE
MPRWIRLLFVYAALTALAAPVAVTALAASNPSGVTGDDLITTAAGTNTSGFSGDGGPATKAHFGAAALGLAVDKQGNIYVADTANNRVRKVTACGTITTFAGTGAPGFSGDGGPATKAQLNGPWAVDVDKDGNVLIADSGNGRVRKVSPDGAITTIAGGGTVPWGQGGPATQALLGTTNDVAADGQGNVYVMSSGNALEKIRPDGTMILIARARGYFSGVDHGDTTESLAASIHGIAADAQGNLYIMDLGIGQYFLDKRVTVSNNRVVKVRPDGSWTTIAGGLDATGARYMEGPAVNAILEGTALAADAQGNVYFVQPGGIWDYVRKISGGRISTVISEHPHVVGYGDGGPAKSAAFGSAGLIGYDKLAVDRNGALYAIGGGFVRKIWTTTPSAAPELSLSAPATELLDAQHALTVSASCDKPCAVLAGGALQIGDKIFKLTATKADTGGLCQTALTLRLPASVQAQVLRLLKPGVKARAAFSASASSNGHHSPTVRRSIKVTR